MRARFVLVRATRARFALAARRRGLTLVELLLAIVLLAVLMIGVFQLLDRSLSLWRRGETRRALLEQSAAILDMLASDLRGIENGQGGDLVLEWVRFDTDQDGIAEAKWPRLRLVRQGSAADVERIRSASRATDPLAPSGEDAPRARASPGLIEVVWLAIPASLVEKDARAEGVLWRGERLVGDAATKSVFAPDFFGTSNRPPAGATEEVSGGILWMQPMLATQTSLVYDGWRVGEDPASAATSWDAWSRERPDVESHAWNQVAQGMPKAGERPLLPRRVRIELEIERPQDRLRRTRLVEPIELGDALFEADDPARIPREPDAHVLVDAEWMKVTSVDGREVRVVRAQRGTTATAHAVGALVHYGPRLVREVPITLFREDWDL